MELNNISYLYILPTSINCLREVEELTQTVPPPSFTTSYLASSGLGVSAVSGSGRHEHRI